MTKKYISPSGLTHYDEKIKDFINNSAGKSHTHSNATTSDDGFMSSSDKTKLDGISAGAEVNQNTFSNVSVGSTTVSADNKTDTLTLEGNNVTLTTDTSVGKVTIGITKDNVTNALGYTPPTTNTTYKNATKSVDGLMSSSDKTKLDGIATGANKTVVDSAMSSTSTNPVQNKIIKNTIDELNSLIGDVSLITKGTLQEQINELRESLINGKVNFITSTEDGSYLTTEDGSYITSEFKI